MRFNNRSMALLGIPDLPLGAFEHIGDRKIKPQGGGGGGLLSSISQNPAFTYPVTPGSPISGITDQIDKFGNPAGSIRDSQGNLVEGFIAPTGNAGQALTEFINPQTGQRVTVPSGGYTAPPGFVLASQAQNMSGFGPNSLFDPNQPYVGSPATGMPATMITPPSGGPISGITDQVDKFGNPARGIRDDQGNPVEGFIPPSGPAATVMVDYINPQTGRRVTAPSGGYTPAPGFVLASQAQQNVNQPVQAPRFLPSEPITPGTGSNISAVQPFLNEGLRQAQELFLRQSPQMFQGQTYVSPSEQTLTALQAQENIARQQSPLLGAAQGAFLQSLGGISNTAAGQYLNANPYQQQMIQAATRPLEQAFSQQVLPGISSLFSKSGRLGSGAMERALSSASEGFGRSLGDITSNIAGTQFQQERGLQQQAALQLANLAQQAPSLYGQQFIPSQQLAQVGAQREAIAGQPLQEAMNRFSYEQQLPYQQLSGFLSSVYGSPLGSFGVPNTMQPSSNRTVGALAGGLAGGLGGYALGQAFPALNFGGGYGLAGAGALGGGLLGGGFF